MADPISLLLCGIFLSLFDGSTGEQCREEGFVYDKYFTCSTGCCGSYYNRYCCPATSGGAIAGIVVGVLFLLGLIISIIVCCVCCMRRSPGQRGQVMRTNQSHVTIVSGTTNSGFVPAYQPQPQPGFVAPTMFNPAPPYPQSPPQDLAVAPPPYSEVVKTNGV